ncbi:hypothetical protein EC9_38320 [Rosistilla ulvae]|uniref:Uncharacterized protein n=1 Tax=Rosistilla ulvae TaxID=1930277 RepID=A0A517M429_9BACT|nr:hypothetical protein EC9_38320 [Rosistilla ulvae]
MSAWLLQPNLPGLAKISGRIDFEAWQALQLRSTSK